MKFIHFADLHLGYENYSLTDEKTGLSTRLLGFLKCFDFLVKTALKEKVDFVFFTGDACKTREPAPIYVREFAKRIKKLADNNIKVIMIVGNHDIPNTQGKADTLELFPTLKIKNVWVFSEIGLHTIDNVQVLVVPWIFKNTLLTETDLKKPIDKQIKIFSQKLNQKVSDLLEKADSKKPLFLLAHYSTSGVVYSSGIEAVPSIEPQLSLSLLSDKKITYSALGHIHKFQVLNDTPPVIMPGSIERIDFGEEKEEKGFILGEVKGKKVKWQFVKTPATKFLTIKVKGKNLLKKIAQKAKIAQNAIVRVQLVGTEKELSTISELEIKKILKSAFMLVSVSKETIETAEKKEVDLHSVEQMTMIDWLKKYLKVHKFSKKEQEEIIKTANELIEEAGVGE